MTQKTHSTTGVLTEPLNMAERNNEALLTERIHLLGLGSIGTLTAHCLRGLSEPPPVSLLLHRPALFEEFQSRNGKIKLTDKSTGQNNEQGGFDADLLEYNDGSNVGHWRFSQGTDTTPRCAKEILNSGETYIYSLIVTVKGPATVSALRAIKHRVNAESTICLLQNGMGQIEELNDEVFPDPALRPTYLIGIVHHGAHMAGQFSVNHAGAGTLALGVVRDVDKHPFVHKSQQNDVGEDVLLSNPSASYILRILQSSPVLACTVLPHLEILQRQLEKLAMNAVLNPLTALLDVHNGAMLRNAPWETVQGMLLAEISLVFQALPELQESPNVSARFSLERLKTLFVELSEVTARNSSSMREDVRNAKGTEINYINGYIVSRGEELGISCVLNRMILELVKGKTLSQEK